MPHNITGSNVFTDPVPALSDGDPVAEVSSDPTTQALANRDIYLSTEFQVEHHDITGLHKNVHADTVSVGGGNATIDGAGNISSANDIHAGHVLTAVSGVQTRTSSGGTDTINGFIANGTFTPVVTFVTTNITHTVQKGRYLRIGAMVVFSVVVKFTFHSSGSAGEMRLGGFPYLFTYADATNGLEVACSSQSAVIGASVTGKQPYGFTALNTGFLNVTRQDATVGATNLLASDLTDGATGNYLQLVGNYFTTDAF
jgi:hypothetical protein